jgi:hypothetical protein
VIVYLVLLFLTLQKTYCKHWLARIAYLIILPISIYVLSFILHFAILYKSGTGDAQMSSLFQANLAGNDFQDYPLGKHCPQFRITSHFKNKNSGRIWICNFHQEQWTWWRSSSFSHPDLPSRIRTATGYLLSSQRL